VVSGAGKGIAGNVAFIPARGGSKRLPRKNLLPFKGKPMLAHTVAAAVGSGVFERVIFSSDDAEMRTAAAAAGAELHDRPLDLAADDTSLIAVVRRVAADFQLGGKTNLCLLMPNCPLREAGDVRGSWEAFRAAGLGFQITAYAYPMFNPFWALEQVGGELKPVQPDLFPDGGKKHPEMLLPSGAIWWAVLDRLLAAGTFYGPGLRPYLIPWHRAVDIDTREEFRLAEIIAAAQAAEPGLFAESR
jgi:pseudaminic acid cytidylyltransferase